MKIFLKIRYYKWCIKISDGIDPTKSNNSQECMICHYWFFYHGFNFQDYVCNGCHDLAMLNVNISGIAITTIKNVEYCCIVHIIHNISKPEAIHLLENSVLEDHGYL